MKNPSIVKTPAGILLGVIFLTSLLASPALAGRTRQITLTDGSVIQGEVASLSNGVYKINTSALGTVSIPESKIQSITSGGSGFRRSSRSSAMNAPSNITRQAPRTANPMPRQNSMGGMQGLSGLSRGGGTADQYNQIKQQLMSDPETMKLIQNLQNNSNVQQIIQDEDLMRAINSQDLGRVGQDPKIQQLMQSQEVRQILQNSRAGR